ncbi:IS701 family transposase [Kitasatospora sp. NPDC097691]|uniref:IS701 family transposase n=1 Tax=Kitasatospora sp. NPDC097691 TaxID=3157231 RepID=UPI0033334D5E
MRVFLAYASSRGRALIGRRLYLPEHTWSRDTERRRRAGVPEDVVFTTKPRLALQMIEQALDAGVSTSWVTGDEAYGHDPGLRAALEVREVGYVLAISCATRVRINQGRTAVRADEVAGRLPASAWHRQSAGPGAKGPRYYDWAWVHIGTDEHRHLLVRGNPTTDELAFCLCWAPRIVPLSELVRVAGTRWCIEECFQAAKCQVGLDHYQVRNWTAWHRHVTLAMLALAFLAVAADVARPTWRADPNRPTRSGEPVDLSIPEIRRLIGALFSPPVTSLNALLHWSNWRTSHQASARRSHYRRRLSVPSGT